MMSKYDKALDYEDSLPPKAVVDGLPEDLINAKIKGGKTHPPDESIRLNGPPGAGKSTQICLRLATLIEEYDVDPQAMTVVTYRRSLADTIKTRLMQWGVIDEDVTLRHWTTQHAAANRVLGMLGQKYDKNTGQSLGPAVTEAEKYVFCEKVLNVPYHGDHNDDTRGELLFETIEYAHNNLLDPKKHDDLQRVPAWDDLTNEWPGIDIAKIYDQWLEFKQKNDLIEFWELLDAARTGPLPPTSCVVIDEYHDVTPLMAKVAERWVSAADTAIVAGDPLQVVNAYAGADPHFFSGRMDHLPEILLDKSWRCSEEHWQAAARMLEPEFTAPPIDRDGRGEIVEYRSPPFYHIQGEGWDVPGEQTPGSPAAIVTEYVTSGSDMLMLARTRSQVEGVSKALDKSGVVHGCQIDGYGWTDHMVNVLNAIIKLSNVPGNYGQNNTQSGLMEYTNTDKIKLTIDETAAMLQHVHAGTLKLTSDERDKLVEELQGNKHGDVMRLDDLDEFVNNDFWSKYTDGVATTRRLTKSREFDDDDLKALQSAAIRYNTPVKQDKKQQIRVLTIHAAKGSEATDVVVYDGITSSTQQSLNFNKEARENEARTWYVALTRARERLHIMREAFGWVTPHLPQNLRVNAVNRAGRTAATDGGDPQ